MIFEKHICSNELKRPTREARIGGSAGTVSNEQLAALNTWEDEGGRTSEPARAVGNGVVAKDATQEQ